MVGNVYAQYAGRSPAFAAKCRFTWPFGMRPYYRRVFADLSRIRTIADAYRNAYPYKGGRWGYLAVATVGDGMICLTCGSLLQYVPSSVSLTGLIWQTFSVSDALYVYAFDYAPPIVRFVDASPKTRS